MGYTANQIDRMSIEELESLTYVLTAEQLTIWTGAGYDGATFVKLTKLSYDGINEKTDSRIIESDRGLQ